MLTTLRHALDAFDRISQDPDNDSNDAVEDAATELAGEVRELIAYLEQPGSFQALALARLMRDRPGSVHVVREPFDLPEGYWLARFGMGGTAFECGIAPDGSVSS